MGATNRHDGRAGGPLQATRPPFVMREIVLTDGWNYVKVVVGSNLICAEVRMKSGHSFWAKYPMVRKDIGLQRLFNDYWNPENHNLTVLGWLLSPIVPAYPLIENGRAYRLWKI